MPDSINTMQSSTTTAGGSSGGGAVEQAQEKVSQAADQAREKAQQTTEQAKGLLRDQVDKRSSQAAIQINSTAQDLRSVGEELRRQGKDTPARFADQVAEKAEQLGGYLRTNDADRLLRDVEQLARRQPWAVLAGGLTLGFVASRFLKASSSQRYNTQFTSTRSRSELRSPVSDTTEASPAPTYTPPVLDEPPYTGTPAPDEAYPGTYGTPRTEETYPGSYGTTGGGV